MPPPHMSELLPLMPLPEMIGSQPLSLAMPPPDCSAVLNAILLPWIVGDYS